MFKNRANGLVSGYKHQVNALKKVGVDFVERADLNADILQLNVSWPRSRWLMWRMHRRGKPVIMYAHSTVEDSLGVFWYVKYVAGIWHWWLASTYGKADILACPSEYTKKLMITKYGISAEKCRVVTNGVDTEKFVKSFDGRKQVRSELNARERMIVGTVGLVVPRKGIDTFERVARTLTQQLFVWVGSAFSKKQIPEIPKSGPGSNMVFTGFVPSVTDYLSAMDIFLFPSHEENQGIAILEAASMGLPIVVRNLPAYEGWLVHGKNCLIAKSEDDFVKYVEQLAHDEQKRRTLGEAARKIAVANDLAVVGERLQSIYSELL